MISRLFNVVIVVASALIFSTGCSKDDSGSGTKGTNFSPQTANSTWTYKNTPGSIFTLTATNRDTVALGKTYRVYTSTAGANVYMGKSGDDYYRFGSIAELGLNGVEELYLKGGDAVNSTWSMPQNVNVPTLGTIAVTLKYTIKEKGATRVVGTKTFTNVTYVRLDLSIPLPITLGGGDFYYADGIGLIESSFKVTVPGQANIDQAQVLTDYSIK